jgi:hypothetical protein
MSSIFLKLASLLPYWKIAKWLLAETGYQRDVALWLASEQQWYFKLAADLWGQLTLPTPVTVASLQAALVAGPDTNPKLKLPKRR